MNTSLVVQPEENDTMLSVLLRLILQAVKTRTSLHQ